MAKELSGTQMLALTAALDKNGFDKSISAEIVGFVRSRCLASWAPEPAAPQPVAPSQTRAGLSEQGEILASLAELGAIQDDASEELALARSVGLKGFTDQDEILASLADFGAIEGNQP